MEYVPTIGLEIHAELATETKMFCRSRNDPDEKRPNVNICPVCLAHPGTLPVINREAVRQVLRVGAALGGTLADFTEFDRKNYFYPDLPKGYQISQYQYPLVAGGMLCGVPITRVHLEEDTGRNAHLDGKSLVDFNRAGVPLMELVTEPAIRDAATAVRFAQELQLLLRALGASEANMEKGEMRVEANVSVSRDPKKFGTKVEVKNLNSFRAVGRAIAHEIERQAAAIESGRQVEQETRGWDDGGQKTFSQRKKESSHDYRYFPDPDLPKLFIRSIPEFQDLAATLPELPWQKRARYAGLGIAAPAVEVLVSDPELGACFEKAGGTPLAANYLTSDVMGLGGVGKMTSEAFAELLRMLEKNEISSRGAKDVLAVLVREGGSARSVAESAGLLQKSDVEELEKLVEKILFENKNAVSVYASGGTGSLQFLIGQAMKATKGAGNPVLLKQIFEKKLR